MKLTACSQFQLFYLSGLCLIHLSYFSKPGIQVLVHSQEAYHSLADAFLIGLYLKTRGCV